MTELLVPVLYVAIPSIILMLAFVAFLRKEEKEIEEDRLQEEKEIRDKT